MEASRTMTMVETQLVDVQQVMNRLRWLADRMQEHLPNHWSEAAKASDANHDRLSCTEEFHTGCHKFGLAETARQSADALAILRAQIGQLSGELASARSDCMTAQRQWAIELRAMRERAESAEARLAAVGIGMD